jgi:signal transduction histidine kinase
VGAKRNGPAGHVTTLEWAVAIYLFGVGSLMLVAPDEFGGAIFTPLHRAIGWVGAAWLVAGVALIGHRIVGAAWRWRMAAHALVAVPFLAFAYNGLGIGTWTVALVFALFALATLAEPFVGDPVAGDYLALVFGAINAIQGGIFLLLPSAYAAPVYNVVRPAMPLYATGFVLAGGALVVAQLDVALPLAWRRVIHLAWLVPFAPWLVNFVIPVRTWPAAFWFGELPLIIALLPWLGPRLRAVDPRSLAVRFAVLLALIAAVPLIAITSVTTGAREQLARQDAEAGLETSAVAAASSVANLIELHQDALDVLAASESQLPLRPDNQQELMRRAAEAFPDALAFDVVDANGQQIARSDGQPLIQVSGTDDFEQVRRTNARALVVKLSLTYHLPNVALAAPIRDADGHFVGFVSVGILSTQIANILNRGGVAPTTRIFLIDAAGRAIVHPDAGLVARFADLSDQPEVAAALRAPTDRGSIATSSPAGDVLAGYARVPGLGWSVIADEPANVALAEVRAGEDSSYGGLLLGVALTIVIAVLVARWIVRPLHRLAEAEEALGRGDPTVPLPKGGGSEVESLVASFAVMRVRLAERAADAEAAVRAAEAEAALRERDEFLSVAAHELKTPVTSLRGLAQLLRRFRRRGDDSDWGRVGEIASQIDRQSVRLTNLVNQLLDLSRVESGKLTVDRHPLDVASVVEEVVATFRTMHPGRDFVLSVVDRPTIAGDALRLEQVLTNLLDNAVKFSPKEAPIEVMVAQNGAATARVAVRDHGPGIPPEARERIFERFYQMDDGSWHGGLGLGLYISRQIVELHGGSIRVDGSTAEGAAIAVVLPLTGPGAEEERGAS